jgi:hypothetical protein
VAASRTLLAANFSIAKGYTGQNTETLALPSDPAPFERVVGVPYELLHELELDLLLQEMRTG